MTNKWMPIHQPQIAKQNPNIYSSTKNINLISNTVKVIIRAIFLTTHFFRFNCVL